MQDRRGKLQSYVTQLQALSSSRLKHNNSPGTERTNKNVKERKYLFSQLDCTAIAGDLTTLMLVSQF